MGFKKPKYTYIKTRDIYTVSREHFRHMQDVIARADDLNIQIGCWDDSTFPGDVVEMADKLTEALDALKGA